jgi:hypothetical protein
MIQSNHRNLRTYLEHRMLNIYLPLPLVMAPTWFTVRFISSAFEKTQVLSVTQ